MDQIVSKAAAISLKQRENSKFQDFFALINLFPLPVLCIDKEKGFIVHVNPELCSLTGFSSDELRDKTIEMLFNGVSADHLVNRGTIYFLSRSEQSPMPVRVNVHYLDASEQVIALILFPSQSPEIDAPLDYFELLAKVIDMDGCCDEAKACDELIATISKLLDVDEVLIYLANSTAPNLQMVSSINTETPFPKTVLAGDLIKLKHAQLWRPSLPANNDIHRTGRIEHYKFLATSTLRFEKSHIGLLLVGDKEKKPSDNLLKTLDLLGIISARIIQSIIHRNTIAQKVQSTEENNSILAAAIENTEEGIIYISPDLRVEWINPSAEMIFGYADEEVSGQPAENILVGPEGLINALVNASTGMPTHNMGDIAIHRRDGQAFPAHLQVIPVMTDQVIGIFVFVHDVTENQQIRLHTQQLEQRAFIGDLTSIFAHEVRNPINNIYSGLQLMQRRLDEGDPNFSVIEKMQDDFKRLNHLMESLLSYSRPMHRTEDVDIHMMIRSIMKRWHPRLIRQKVNPFFQSDGKPAIVEGDHRALEQVFINLISNALDAMSPEGGTLAIHINYLKGAPGRPQIEVSITDNGPGIPDEFRDRVFEPFITNKPRGTGLGLAITKQIVTAHKGTVSVSSFPGGTVFHVYLPAITEKLHERDSTDRR